MKRYTIITLIIIAVACILFIAFNNRSAPKENIDNSSNVDQTVTRYFGNESKGDIDGDGVEDRAYLVTEDGGGSGTFFYATIALKTPTDEVIVGKILLGDRIAPQSTNIKDGIVTINYADRGPNDSFVIKPYIGKSLQLVYDVSTKELIPVSTIPITNTTTKITDHPWTWTKTIYNNDTVITPRKKDSFVITFAKDNRFSAKTDCNSVGGEYTINGSKIILNKMMSTLMYCENSQESDFTKMLTETDNFFINYSGELVLGLKYDSGSIIFK